MGAGFSHSDIIASLKEHFPEYLKQQTGVDFVFRNEYKDKKGSGDGEVLILEVEGFILIDGGLRDVKVPIAFVENSAGEMEIQVDKSTVHKVKRMEGNSPALIENFTKAIREYVSTKSGLNLLR